nr:uncharacterized protein LOC129260526 [Lytechinus pictus]
MASNGMLFCIFALIAALCVVTEAGRPGEIRKTRHVVGAPQKQTMFDIPFDQTNSVPVAGSAGSVGASSVFVMDSGSSEESDLDMDVDMADMDTDANEVDAGDAPVMVGGNQVNGNLLTFLSNDRGDAVEAGNADSLLSRTSGSSARGVGIAFAVLGLLIVIVAAAAFTLRKYRHSIPVIVRV